MPSARPNCSFSASIPSRGGYPQTNWKRSRNEGVRGSGATDCCRAESPRKAILGRLSHSLGTLRCPAKPNRRAMSPNCLISFAKMRATNLPEAVWFEESDWLSQLRSNPAAARGARTAPNMQAQLDCFDRREIPSRHRHSARRLRETGIAYARAERLLLIPVDSAFRGRS